MEKVRNMIRGEQFNTEHRNIHAAKEYEATSFLEGKWDLSLQRTRGLGWGGVFVGGWVGVVK